MAQGNGLRGLGLGRGVASAPRDPSIPTRPEEDAALKLALTQHLAQQRAMFNRLQHAIGTLDSIIYEHNNIQLDITKSTVSLTLDPQTTQTEIITGLFASIVVPNTSAAPTITITNAWAKLGGDYINLNAILNSSGGTGGFLPGNYRFILGSHNSRSITLVSSSNWPAGAYLTFSLFGDAVPTLDGGVLH